MATPDIGEPTHDALETAADHTGAAVRAPDGGRTHLAPAVLIVERDELLRWALYETLREAGYRLLPIRDEAHTKELIDRLPEPFAAAVIDHDAWPMMDGAATWLRERWPGLPILVLADEALPALARQVQQMGAADLMVKPFEIAELRTRVARLVRLGRRAARARSKSSESAAA